ncbi:MAG: fumarate hydratase C-terminal domain-containing protein [Candidatus Caldatribacteriaceae bacterium]
MGREFVLKTPLSVDEVMMLRAGDAVSLSGELYVARDATHRRMVETWQRGEEVPVQLSGSVLYYAGPTPAPPPHVVGSIGPTTSSRMDRYLSYVLARGVRATIGKGPRSLEAKQLGEKFKALYFVTCGGAGAYLSTFVLKKEVCAYEDLGAQALLRIFVRDFPLLVAYDMYGGDVFEEGKIAFRKR